MNDGIKHFFVINAMVTDYDDNQNTSSSFYFFYFFNLEYQTTFCFPIQINSIIASHIISLYHFLNIISNKC
jgi:hypothetical protein